MEGTTGFNAEITLRAESLYVKIALGLCFELGIQTLQ